MELKNALDAAKSFKYKRKNTFKPRLIATFTVFIMANFTGLLLALSQAKGMMAKASNAKIQMINSRFWELILVKF